MSQGSRISKHSWINTMEPTNIMISEKENCPKRFFFPHTNNNILSVFLVFRSSDCASETANQSEMAIAQTNEREKKPCHFSGRHSRVCRNRECFFLERVPVNESSETSRCLLDLCF
ncbi:hypothetical protein CEXT_793621 [Caerostris extrusa]|uniref:Uncharacterized protein n=1 Tax=Caerostris extrusa TaxID=172846 RepID=A0AAV4VZH8_CAEEX|nr:hypothetical protein CEXT_793621 [Caerostris extrusa]